MIIKKLKAKYIIGIDEVGRGALAGPVTVAAVLLPQKFQISKYKFQINLKIKILNSKLKLKDSKKLSSQQRESWFEWLKKNSIPYVTASVSPKVIDKVNISKAANLAATKAVDELIAKCKLRIKNCKILLDGGLYLKNLKFKNQNPKFLNSKSYILNSRTIIRGDEKIPAISLASIVAKVTRDRLMKKLHEKYPRYDFINNVGYGTKKHIKAIKKFGFSKIHRKSFRV